MSASPSAAHTSIVPFWNRLPQVMLYPAHTESLFVIVALALLNFIAVSFGLFGLILLLISTITMFSYAFECLQVSSDGLLKPPKIASSFGSGLGRKFCALIFVLSLLVGFSKAHISPTFSEILDLFLTISLPAAAMTLAVEESLTEALNPLKWIDLITAIGWPYLAVVGLGFAIENSETYALVFLAKFLPPQAVLVAIFIVSNYVLVMIFHVLGYLLYQSHEKLGLTPAVTLSAVSAKTDPDQGILDEAAERVREGKPEEAAELLRAYLPRSGSQSVHTQYRKLLRLTDNKAALIEHDRKYIGTLMEEEKDRLAVEFLCECQSIDPTFSPETDFQITQLAHLAAKMGQPRAAVQLVKVFDQRFPSNKYTIDNGLLAAGLMSEHMNQDEEALVLLRSLKARYPNDKLIADVDARIAMIEKIMVAMKKPARSNPQGA